MKLDGKVAIVTGGAMGNGLGIVKMFFLVKNGLCQWDLNCEH